VTVMSKPHPPGPVEIVLADSGAWGGNVVSVKVVPLDGESQGDFQLSYFVMPGVRVSRSELAALHAGVGAILSETQLTEPKISVALQRELEDNVVRIERSSLSFQLSFGNKNHSSHYIEGPILSRQELAALHAGMGELIAYYREYSE